TTLESPKNTAANVGTISLGRGQDIETIKKKLGDVLQSRQVAFNNIFDLSMGSIANEFYQVGIITQDVHRSPTYDTIIRYFLASISIIGTQSEIEKECGKFLTALCNVGGPVARAADVLKEDWEQAMKN
uniref:Uncharacterized protein n=1 Tax=Amphimedon queenslandica TaxID=400682 RepID=A0A1X7T8Y9_AMPQE